MNTEIEKYIGKQFKLSQELINLYKPADDALFTFEKIDEDENVIVSWKGVDMINDGFVDYTIQDVLQNIEEKQWILV